MDSASNDTTTVSLDPLGDPRLGPDRERVDLDDLANETPPDSDYWEPAETVVAAIPVGGPAGDIAVGPDSDHVYVAAGNAVKVIGSSNSIVGTFPVAAQPKCLAVNADGTRVYVASYDGSVSAIDTTNDTVSTISGPGSAAEAISPDGAHIYTAHNVMVHGGYRGRVSVVDAEGTPVAAVPVDHYITGLAVSPDSRRLYAATSDRGCYYQYDLGWLCVIDTCGHTVIDTITLSASADTVTVSPDASRIYLTHNDTESISVVDLATHRATSIAVQDVPLGVTVTPDGAHAYVTGLRSLAIIDAVTNAAESVSVGDLPRRVEVSSDGKRAYVTSFGDHTVSVLDTITNSVITTIEVGGHPEAMAVSPNGERLYITDYWTGTVTVIAIPSVKNHEGD